MKNYLRIVLFSILAMAGVRTAAAVPPPDFLFNIGSQIAQFFSIAILFLSAIVFSAGQFFKVYLQRIHHRKLLWVTLALGVVVISFVAANGYRQVAQDKAYQQWIVQSEAENINTPATENPLDQLKLEDTVPLTGGQAQVADSNTAVVPPMPPIPEDERVIFIKKYYDNLASGHVEDAYAVSKKSVSLETYKGWYKDVSSVTLSKIQEIDANKYSLRLSLAESGGTTDYAVLMTLAPDGAGSFRIADSQVRTLSAADSKTAEKASEAVAETVVESQAVPAENADFFVANESLPNAISNQDFQKVLDSQKEVYVLDAREDEEFEIGQFPKSIHIRSADLVAGDWISLPTDKVVYVFCWSGIRGREVAEFLRSKKIVARYVENGANDWVAFGGKWDGGIKFLSKYSESRYQKVFTMREIEDQIAAGTVLVDSRPKDKFDRHHIAGSVNIPMIYTPSGKVDAALAQVPKGATVITVCDDFVSCFDAKVTGIKLEKRGHVFLGRYNKPWEF